LTCGKLITAVLGEDAESDAASAWGHIFPCMVSVSLLA
jgi:hypothetical protein